MTELRHDRNKWVSARIRTGRAALLISTGMTLLAMLLPASTAASPVRQSSLLQGAIPERGLAVAGFTGVDAAVTKMISDYGIPGAELGVVHAGRLVYLRGYGYANVGTSAPVQLESVFRIASISKPLTATAALTLVDHKQLSLNSGAFGLIPDIGPPDGATEDPQIPQVTVKDLIEHRGGWDRNATFDPMFSILNAASELGVDPPLDCPTIIGWMLGYPLDFAPGTKSVYSNFGYCVLGQVVAEVAGMPFGAYLKQAVLDPLHMTHTGLGRSLTALPGEVSYYDYPGAGECTSVFDGSSDVPCVYGGFSVEALSSAGGLVSTSSDLLRFLTSLNGTRGSDLLKQTFQSYGLDFGEIPPKGSGWTWYFEGSLPGTRTILAMDATGDGFALLTNTRRDDTDFDAKDPLWNSVGKAVWGVSSWPNIDMFALPNIATMSPNLATAGAAITITGSHFTGATDVSFNGVPASFSVVSDSKITAQVPDATTGPITVTADAGTGTSATSFTFAPPPNITTAPVPDHGPVGTIVSISGENLSAIQSVTVSGAAAKFKRVSDSAIELTVPSAATTGAIGVTTPGGTALSSSFAVTPIVAAVSPGRAAALSSVTITGSGLTGVTEVAFNGHDSPLIVSNTATRIVARVPADADNGSITVTTAGGTSDPSKAIFKPIPTITLIGGDPARVGDSVTVSGGAFTAAGTPTVRINSLVVLPDTISATAISFAVPDGAITGPITVADSNGTTRSKLSLHIPPTISSGPSPSHGRPGTTVTLTGYTFAGTRSVKIGPTSAKFKVVSSHQLQLTIPKGAASNSIVVLNAGGSATSDTFTVDP